jgi:hypothetical protein
MIPSTRASRLGSWRRRDLDRSVNGKMEDPHPHRRGRSRAGLMTTPAANWSLCSVGTFFDIVPATNAVAGFLLEQPFGC